MNAAVAGVLRSKPVRTGSRPRSVQWLFALLIAGMVLGVLSVAAVLTLPDGIPAGFDDLGGLSYFYAIAVGIVIAIDVPLAFAIRRGRRWAWTTRLVFAVIGLPGALEQVVNPVSGGFAVERLLSTVSALVAIAVLVLLLVRPTRTFVHVGPDPRPGRVNGR